MWNFCVGGKKKLNECTYFSMHGSEIVVSKNKTVLGFVFRSKSIVYSFQTKLGREVMIFFEMNDNILIPNIVLNKD